MGLDDLAGCIEVLKERMRSYRTDLEENEIRTRAALIDPLLRALGWDVSDPGMVMPEYKIDNKPAAYALFQSNGRPAATLEAKKLGEPLRTLTRIILLSSGLTSYSTTTRKAKIGSLVLTCNTLGGNGTASG